MGAVMFDFNKGFDLVDHKLLLEKIKCFKCSDKFVSLMKSYLSSRSQVVSVNSKKSENGFVKCGVPQGSILGPLLFLIFINDLPLYLSNRVYSTDLYADDTTIYDKQSDYMSLSQICKTRFWNFVHGVSRMVWYLILRKQKLCL